MKLSDFFTPEGKKSLRQMIFLGKFIQIDETTIDVEAWQENYHYQNNHDFLFIQNTTIFPETLQKILPITSIFPCAINKQRNKEKLTSYKLGDSYAVESLNNQFVLYQLKFVKDILEVKLVMILSNPFHEDTYVFPVGKRREERTKEQPFVETLDVYTFSAYPSIFGIPNVFYAGNQIYAVEQNFVFHLPIEAHIHQILFKNDHVAVIQFESGFLLYEPVEVSHKSEVGWEENTTAIVLYREDHQKTETQFFERLQENLKAEEIWLQDIDLLYFHASLKSHPFTLLKGKDEQIKSRLCAIYAKTLGGVTGENIFYLYPKASWSNIYDLLLEQIPAHEFVFYQYPNLMTFLARANENPEQLYFCILEDINLSRPEYYLQQFLTILHKKGERAFHYKNTFQQRGISLERLPIGENVIFIGISNLSEVSYPLTDICLGQMSIVELTPPQSFVQILNEMETDYDWNVEYLSIPTSVYRKHWRKTVDPYTFFTKDELQFFDSINQLLCEGLSKYRIFPYTLKNMATIMVNGLFSQATHHLMPRKQWLDRCLYEYVIQKMSGVHPSFHKIFGTYHGHKWRKGELVQLLESDYGKKFSNFTWSVEKIKEKVRRFEDEGFFD